MTSTPDFTRMPHLDEAETAAASAEANAMKLLGESKLTKDISANMLLHPIRRAYCVKVYGQKEELVWASHVEFTNYFVVFYDRDGQINQAVPNTDMERLRSHNDIEDDNS